MRDPWHRETLEGLVAYIDAAARSGGTAWAVVVVSSERLGGEVVGELGGRLGTIDSLRVCTYLDPRAEVSGRLDQARGEAFRTTFVEGLSAVIDSDEEGEILGWLNLRREDFERPGEAFVFVLSRGAADRWSKEAPDLDRYTQHFEFEDWDDLVEEAQRAAEEMELTVESGEVLLERAEKQVARARILGGDQLAEALVDWAQLVRHQGNYSQAEDAIAEAIRLGEGAGGALRGRVVEERARRRSIAGHPDEALDQLLATNQGETHVASRMAVLGWAYFYTGEFERASSCLELYLELASSKDMPRVALANLDQWRGRPQDALRHVLEVSDSSKVIVSYAYLLLGRGEASKAIGLLMRALRTCEFRKRAIGAQSAKIGVALASLHGAQLHRAALVLEVVRASHGSQSAQNHGLAILHAKALGNLDGPLAVAAIVDDEQRRQLGWTAPIPAAELAYVRGLAATSDEDARHHFQDASDRYRAMEGWLYLSEIERHLARLDRLDGDLDRASARVDEGLTWHAREGARPSEARDRTELAMIALGRRDPQTAFDEATAALELIRACKTRIYEPAALVALAAAERALGHAEAALAHDQRWRRLVRGIDAKGLETALERDAAWASAQRAD